MSDKIIVICKGREYEFVGTRVPNKGEFFLLYDKEEVSQAQVNYDRLQAAILEPLVGVHKVPVGCSPSVEEEIKSLNGEGSKVIPDKPTPYHIKNIFKGMKQEDVPYWLDWYDLIDMIRASDVLLDPRVEHSLKKIYVNDRGHKSLLKDVEEAIWSLGKYRDKLLKEQLYKEFYGGEE